jgi:hypothetical protein
MVTGVTKSVEDWDKRISFYSEEVTRVLADPE